MLDRFVELAVDKVPVSNVIRLRDRGSAQIAVGEASGLYQAARAVLMQTARQIWGAGEAGEDFTPRRLAEQRVAT